jgi:hypothetical protein
VDALFTIELEPEVRDWLEALPAKHFLKIDEYVGLLAEHAAALGEPYPHYLATESGSCARPSTVLPYASRTCSPRTAPRSC